MLKNLKFKALIISFLLFISYFLFPISVAHALTEEIAPQPVSEGTPQLASASVDSQQTDASAPAEEIPSDTNAPDQATPTQTATTLPVNRNTNALLSELTLSTVQVIPAGNSGAAATSIPIAVPPGRKGMTPNISLTYNSNSLNGWIGVGWSLDIGAIQRNTKRGVCYTCNDYVATVLKEGVKSLQLTI